MKKILIALVIVLTGCGPTKVQIIPSDDQVTKISQIVENQGQALQEIIKVLQEKQMIEEKK